MLPPSLTPYEKKKKLAQTNSRQMYLATSSAKDDLGRKLEAALKRNEQLCQELVDKEKDFQVRRERAWLRTEREGYFFSAESIVPVDLSSRHTLASVYCFVCYVF